MKSTVEPVFFFFELIKEDFSYSMVQLGNDSMNDVTPMVKNCDVNNGIPPICFEGCGFKSCSIVNTLFIDFQLERNKYLHG